MSDLTPQEEDFGIVYDYLPCEGHPQSVEEDRCPYCALRRIHSRIAELEAENAKCEEWGKSEARMKEQAEVNLAERERMLRVARERDFTHLGDYETWFNDVKLSARAEEDPDA